MIYEKNKIKLEKPEEIDEKLAKRIGSEKGKKVYENLKRSKIKY